MRPFPELDLSEEVVVGTEPFRPVNPTVRQALHDAPCQDERLVLAVVFHRPLQASVFVVRIGERRGSQHPVESDVLSLRHVVVGIADESETEILAHTLVK